MLSHQSGCLFRVRRQEIQSSTQSLRRILRFVTYQGCDIGILTCKFGFLRCRYWETQSWAKNPRILFSRDRSMSCAKAWLSFFSALHFNVSGLTSPRSALMKKCIPLPGTQVFRSSSVESGWNFYDCVSLALHSIITRIRGRKHVEKLISVQCVEKEIIWQLVDL